MVANPARCRKFIEDFEQEGYPPYLLDKLHAPVGLDLGAETPEEIAISILAEITKVRRGATGLSLREKVKQEGPIPLETYEIKATQ